MSDATTASGDLYVLFIGIFDEETGKRTHDPKWRVNVRCSDGQDRALSIGFERRVDAEMAMHALIKSGFDTESKIRSVPVEERKRLKQLMVEALQW